MLVAALTNERETVRMQTWLAEQTPGELGASEWVRTEFSAALSIKVRLGALMLEHRVAAVDELARLFDHSIVSIPIETATFRTAARLAERHQHGLRAGDALHLAVAALARATICTLDQRLAKAADGLGLQNRLL